ncbi:MAG: DUF151 domain-containing protein [Candidatus Marinimicrobia bacterium]|nr:DUF151 domain-containing protein [Candidatus Neomarinimicrobiota bacterium]MCF7830097.1 DUF151 domain-containing protein [Candidatus Neomarinimicrobiota bacterium]MCF7882144.1 DUF151 domain-containing protein [Candidatus Neomarinimicrobiota bacterium]
MVEVEVAKIAFYPPSKGYAVLLSEVHGDRQLPVIVGAFEAQAIALALEGMKMPRPMTHDLISTILEDLGADIKEVVITDLIDGTFYAKIFLDSYDFSDKEIDSRPSDAIAIALRVGATVYVESEVMEEAGVVADELDAVGEESEGLTEERISATSSGDQSIDELQDALKKAVDAEEYEKAAKLRDKIKQIEEQKN